MTEVQNRILVVDDDADIAINMSDILTDLGYMTDIANDGAAALELVRSRPYSVVLLDFKMPDMDGAALFEKINRLQPQIVAIMVTAYAGSEGVARAHRVGTWQVLRKPIDFDTLLRLVDEAMRRDHDNDQPATP